MIDKELKVIADAILDKKGEDVISIDLRPVGTAITDYFVICTGTSTTMVSAIADNIIKEAREKLGVKPLRMQGMENAFWVIIDFGHIVVHVFLKEYRDFYRLEDLWADAPKKVYEDSDFQKEKEEASAARVKPKAATKVRASVKKVKKITKEEE